MVDYEFLEINYSDFTFEEFLIPILMIIIMKFNNSRLS